MVWVPLCLLPGCLAGCSWFLPSGLFPFCWLLSGAPGSSPSFHSPRPMSLSLSLSSSCSSLSPLGLFLVGSCVCLGYLRSSGYPSPSSCGIPVGIPPFCEVIFQFALSHLPGGVQLFCFPLAPFQSVLLVCPGCWLVFLALSSAFRQVIDRRLLSSLWFGWCLCYLPCGPTPGLSLASWLFHRFFSRGSSLGVFLDSRLLYSLAGYLVLGSSFPVLVICSFLLSEALAVASGYCLSAPLVCLLLLSACLWFLFLGLFFSMCRGFLSSFSGLSFSRSPSCFGLELLLVFLSFPLLGFPVLSSPCGVSHLTTWSLFLSVPRFLWIGWFVLRPLQWFRRLLLFLGLLLAG